jgi:predicted nucleotidyltransferase
VLPAVTQHAGEIADLCQAHGVRRLCLSGSAARAESFAAVGDLDFLVEYEELDPGRYADSYFGLMESLQELFGCPIDLVEAEAIANPYFREAVDSSKVAVYERS